MKTSAEWSRLLRSGVLLMQKDGFDDINWKTDLISRVDFEDRLFQSVIYLPDNMVDIWKKEAYAGEER